MTRKILTTEQGVEVAKQIKTQGKKIVLVGGCFDILHIGHIAFLEKAKEQGDVLIIFLESDENIKKTKGPARPVNTQDDRAKILASLSIVDYVIKLSEITDNTNYDNLVIQLKPAIIATTAGDANRSHKERQAEKIGAKVVDVIESIQNKSTTKVIKILEEI